MELTVNEFWHRISDSGLADAAQCRVWAVAYAKSAGQPAQDARLLAKWMVRTRQLTLYQVENLLKGSSEPLVIDRFQIANPVKSGPFADWFNALDSGKTPKISGKLYVVPPSRAPRLTTGRFARHLQAQDPALQCIDLVQGASTDPMLWSQLPEGKTLSDVLAAGALKSKHVVTLGNRLARALAALHQLGLAHGCVHPQRVWITQSQDIVLLRDPCAQPMSPLEPASEGVLAPIDDTTPTGAYMAPEFSLPGTVPDASTDLYALGCLLYHARFGKPPFVVQRPDQWVSVHSSAIPTELQATESGPHHDPLLRVIAHLMSKNRSSRIPSADRLIEIMGEALDAGARSAEAHDSRVPITSNASQTSQTGATPPNVTTPANVTTPPPLSPPVSQTPTTPPPVSQASTSTPRPTVGDSQEVPATQDRSKQRSTNASGDSQISASNPPEASPTQQATSNKQSATPPTQPATSNKQSTADIPADPQPGPVPVPPPADADSLAAQDPRVAAASSAPATPGDTVPTGATADPSAAANGTATSGAPPSQADAGTQEPKKRKAKRAGTSSRKKAKQKQKAAIVIGGAGFSMLVLLLTVFVVNSRPDAPQRDRRELLQQDVELAGKNNAGNPASQASSNDSSQQASDGAGTPGNPPSSHTNTTPPPATAKFIAVDDPTKLWMPPDASDPPPLDMLPPGTNMIVMLRPADLLSSADGRSLLATLNPELSGGVDALQKRIGVPLGDVQRLMMSIQAIDSTRLSAALRVELTAEKSLGQLKSAWNDPADAIVAENQTIFAGDELDADAYYVQQQPPNDSMLVKRFAVGNIKQIQAVAEVQGSEIPLAPQIESMWKSARSDAHLTVMVLPNFLFADGRSMLSEYAPALIDPLKSILIPNASVAMVTMQFTPDWYGEVRLAPGTGTSAVQLRNTLGEQIDQLPQYGNEFLIGSSPHASWRAVAIGLPRMLESLAKRTRVGISQDQAVANFYLPSYAAPNLMLGTWMAVNTPAGTLAMTSTASSTAKPWTIEEMIEKPVRVSFEQDPLHSAGTTVVEEVNRDRPPGTPELKVVLLGNDLEKAGITQNQQITDFRADNMKLRDVLTQLVQRANIVKGLTDPKDPQQILVWLLGPDPEAPQNQVILITTREGAAAAGYKLMPEFVTN